MVAGDDRPWLWVRDGARVADEGVVAREEATTRVEVVFPVRCHGGC